VARHQRLRDELTRSTRATSNLCQKVTVVALEDNHVIGASIPSPQPRKSPGYGDRSSLVFGGLQRGDSTPSRVTAATDAEELALVQPHIRGADEAGQGARPAARSGPCRRSHAWTSRTSRWPTRLARSFGSRKFAYEHESGSTRSIGPSPETGSACRTADGPPRARSSSCPASSAPSDMRLGQGEFRGVGRGGNSRRSMLPVAAATRERLPPRSPRLFRGVGDRMLAPITWLSSSATTVLLTHEIRGLARARPRQFVSQRGRRATHLQATAFLRSGLEHRRPPVVRVLGAGSSAPSSSSRETHTVVLASQIADAHRLLLDACRDPVLPVEEPLFATPASSRERCPTEHGPAAISASLLAFGHAREQREREARMASPRRARSAREQRRGQPAATKKSTTASNALRAAIASATAKGEPRSRSDDGVHRGRPRVERHAIVVEVEKPRKTERRFRKSSPPATGRAERREKATRAVAADTAIATT